MQLLHHDIPQSSSAVTVASAAASSSSSSPALLQGSTRMRSVSHSNFGYSNSNNNNNYHNLSYPSPVQSGGIRKKPTSSSRHRAVSTSYAAERLHQLALEQQQTTALDFLQQYQQESIPTATDLNWFTPQHSPEPTCFFQEPVQLENQFHWAAPTPPHSDSGIPTLPADVCDEASAQVSSPDSFAFDQVTAAPDMSSLEYLLPSYSNVAFPAQGNNASFDENYPMRTQPPTSASQYGSTVSSSPQFHQTRTATPARRISPNGQPTPPYGLPSRRLNSYETTPQSNYSMPALMPGPSTAPIPSSTPMTQFGGMTRSPALYDAQFYNLTYTTAQPVPPTYAPASDSTYQQGQRASEAAKASTDARGTARCYDHGCNGRRFSTFSNLLRHQREKSGTASKSTCHKCGAEFTRTTARNGHLAHDKCTKGPRITQQ